MPHQIQLEATELAEKEGNRQALKALGTADRVFGARWPAWHFDIEAFISLMEAWRGSDVALQGIASALPALTTWQRP